MVNASGGKAERFSMWNGFDLSTTGGTNRLIAELKRRRPRYLWFAPGCDPWSSINNLNAGDPDREARLRIKRAKSKRIFRNCKRAMSEYLAQEPDSEIVGEQPRRAQSWNATSWAELKKTLFISKFDGCEFDHRNSTGELIQKPWQVATACKRLHLLLDGRLCSHGRGVHPIIQANETALSALYPDKLCKLVVKVILGRGPGTQAGQNLMERFMRFDDVCDVNETVEVFNVIFSEDAITDEQVQQVRLPTTCACKLGAPFQCLSATYAERSQSTSSCHPNGG